MPEKPISKEERIAQIYTTPKLQHELEHVVEAKKIRVHVDNVKDEYKEPVHRYMVGNTISAFHRKQIKSYEMFLNFCDMFGINVKLELT